MKKQIYQIKTILFTLLIINFCAPFIHAMDPAPKNTAKPKPVLPKLSFAQNTQLNTEPRLKRENKVHSQSPKTKNSTDKISKLTTSDPGQTSTLSPSVSPRKSPHKDYSPRALQKSTFKTTSKSKLIKKAAQHPELIQAVHCYDLERIQSILKDRSKDPNEQDQYGNTALHHAIIAQELTSIQKEGVVQLLLSDPRTNSFIRNKSDYTAPDLIARYDADMETVRQVLFARLTLDEAVETTITESLKKADATTTNPNSILEQIKERIHTIQETQKGNTSLPKHIFLPEYANNAFIEEMISYRSVFTPLQHKEEVPFIHFSNNSHDYLEELNMRVHIKHLSTLIAFNGEEKKPLHSWLENKDFLKKTSFIVLSADQTKIKELHSLKKASLGKLIKVILDGNAYYYGYQIGDTHFKHDFKKTYPVLMTAQLPFIVMEK